jgi:23S rRNA (guanosine2251-2'-O)-methyltransferase
MRSIIIIAHNLRSTHNVGSLLRTAEGLGVEMVYLTGYTPYPSQVDDIRLPHLAQKISRDISKTALGAETSQRWEQNNDITALVLNLRMRGYLIAALEQTATARDISNYKPPERIAIILGREVEGVEPEILALTDLQLVIPMLGAKESFNVVQAAAMALYHCRFSR